MIPELINGKKVVPFKGVGKFRPSGKKAMPRIPSCKDFPPDGNKLAESLKDALVKCGIGNGKTISTHHHFRDGDLIAVKIFKIARELGNARRVNTILLGVLSRSREIDESVWRDVIVKRVPKGTEDLNVQAFGRGRSFA